MDFGSIDEHVQPVCFRLDHRLLNEVDGLENPTSEILTSWFWSQLIPQLPSLSAISISETADSVCTYYGPD
jgi:6-pyruvoyltetrahydropterin/6-carboxytetrahydropterin synthase